MDHAEDDIARRIIEQIASLPLEDQEKAIHALIGAVMKSMPEHAIREIRDEIKAEFPADITVVESTLNLINGQLELRAIMGDKAR